MARYKSIINFSGSMGGLTFYTDQNQSNLVKQKNRSYQPTGVGTLRNNSEMGGAATMGRYFRHGIMEVIQQFGDQYLSGRLNGKFREVIAQGEGELGKRGFDLRQHGHLLVGFPFQKLCPLATVLSETLVTPEIDEGRKIVRWELPRFVPRQLVYAPNEATHFQLVLVAMPMSAGVYDDAKSGYEPVVDVGAHAHRSTYSTALAMDAKHIAGFTLEVETAVPEAIAEQLAMVVCVGIVFGQMVNGKLVLLKKGRGMDVVGVF